MKKLFCLLALLPLLLLIAPPAVKAASPLDEIENYQVTVDPQKDGTLNIAYHIDWKVLNDTSEGPLTWVRIGIPNQYADTLTPISQNIRKIQYTGDGGDYVRIDFDKSYYAGNVVSFSFSLHQSHMFTLDKSTGGCSYSFTPGWFDAINVRSMTLLWNKTNVGKSDASGSSGNYLTWASPLAAGQKLTASISYPAGVFDTSASWQLDSAADSSSNIDSASESDSESDSDAPFAVFIPIVLFAGFFVLSLILRIRGGGYRGGFGGRGRGGFWGGGPFIGGGGGGGGACASSCACACACACAGGGRAGCSAKNFYGATVPLRELEKQLREANGETAKK